MAVSPRRIMSDVLLMSAVKLSNPIQIVIQTKTNNLPWLTLRLSLRFHDVLPDRNLRSKCCRDHTPGTAAVNELNMDPLKGRRCAPNDLF